MSTPFHATGLRFQCTRCHACCRHDPGYVFLSQTDLDSLSDFLDIGEDKLRKDFCRVVNFGLVSRLSLIEKKNFDCVFWSESHGGCSVYAARPLQCRSFPFWERNVDSKESWDEAAQHCPGINQGALHSAATIDSWLTARRREQVLEN